MNGIPEKLSQTTWKPLKPGLAIEQTFSKCVSVNICSMEFRVQNLWETLQTKFHSWRFTRHINRLDQSS